MNKNTKRNLIICCAVIVILAVFVVGVIIAQNSANKLSREVSVQEAQTIINTTLEKLPVNVATGAKYIQQNSQVTVNSLSYGKQKNVILDCSYVTYDVETTVKNNIDKYILDAYQFNLQNEAQGKKTNATKIKLRLADNIISDLSACEKIQGDVTIHLYEIEQNVFEMYLSDDIINTVFGGLLNARDIINSATTVQADGQIVSIESKNTLRTGIKDCLKLNNYNSSKPDTNIAVIKMWNTFKNDFYRNFIEGNRWKYLFDGLITTLEITFIAVLIGIIIGFIVAVIRCTNQKTGKLEFLSSICRLYLSIMRGTPIMVQLLIIYFVVLLPIGVEKFIAAVICFGLNSGAYVSEIVRGGIMSIDQGQTEAGRSLGFNYMQTMFYIVIPQAFKAVLPSLANEFITLLKESSVAFYIGVADLTLGGLKIRSITYSNYMPLIAVALIYLILVLGLSKCVSILERRLRKGDNR